MIEGEAGAYPEPVRRLMTELGKLPGGGPRSAERIAQYILRVEKADALALAQVIAEVKDRIHPCRECYSLTEAERCAICTDASRDRGLLCVVEQTRDLAALEAAGAYRGLYHVLMGTLSPLDGIGPDDLTLDALVDRVKKGSFREVILATNPTLEGDGTALAVGSALESLGIPLTRLATGVPTGSFLEHSNRNTLTDALAGRRPWK
jgi:recombination protein RecR